MKWRRGQTEVINRKKENKQELVIKSGRELKYLTFLKKKQDFKKLCDKESKTRRQIK